MPEPEYRPRYPESPFIHLADVVDPSTGKTAREINEATPHSIPLGTLVEILPGEWSDCDDDNCYDGVRLYVVFHHRDCDGTPLYSLGPERHSSKSACLSGFSEDNLKVVPTD